MVMNDVFDRSRYGSGYDVSELVQKILSERLSNREPSAPQTEERVIYADAERTSILDNVTQPLRPTLPEIPEGGDEKDFVEKTLAPSGRRWTSSPPADSQRIVIVRENLNDDDDDYFQFDGGLRYEEIGAGGARGCGTSLENWRNSSCQSPSNVPDTLNGDGMELGWSGARWTSSMPVSGRKVVTSETTRHQEVRTASESAPQTSTTRSRKDAFGRYIPSDAVEIKVQMQRGESEESPSRSRLRDERNASGEEQWLDSGGGDGTSYTSRQRTFVGGGGAVETDQKQEARSGGAVRHQASSDDGWTRVAGTKSTTEKTATDDGRIWIPVIHVSGTSKNEATKSDRSASVHTVETESRRDGAARQAADGRGQVSSTRSRAFIDDVNDLRSRQDRSGTSSESPRDTVVAGRDDQSAATPLRTGSGVGSYGFRSSIVVDRGSTRSTPPVASPTSRSRSAVVLQQSAGDGEWVVEKAL